MTTLLQDLRLSVRSLLRQPLFTGMAAASLALGIGAGTVIFSVVYALLLRPLPYPHPEELVHVGLQSPAYPPGGFGVLAPEVLKTLRHDPQAGFSAVGGFGYDYANLTGVPTPAQLTALLVTVDYFRVFGVPAARGRCFTDDDCRAAAPPTVVLSDHLWRTQFHADEDLVGKTITLSDRPRTVIGIMPGDFKELNDGCELWLPLAEDGPEMAPDAPRRYVVTARLADGSAGGRAKVGAFLALLTGRLRQTHPVEYKDWHLEANPLEGGALIGPGAQRALWLLLGAVGCVLLVTCANVANLQLVRAAARRREVGVRLALGASRARIMRYALTESLVLAVLGAGLGLLAAAWGVDAVAALLPVGYSPLQDGIRLNGTVLGFATGAAIAAGMMTGLLPAWVAARQNPAGSLAASAGRGASEGPGGGRTRGVLVVAEIALALVLLAGAGLMGRSLLAAVRTDSGMRLDRTLMLGLSLSDSRYPDAPRRAEAYRRVLASVEAVPGVAGTALTDTPMFGGWYDDFTFALPGQTGDDATAHHQTAVRDGMNPSGFATLGIPLRQGRLFNEGDTASAPLVAVVNEEIARRYFPNGDALGARITAKVSQLPYEIVGVVGNIRSRGLEENPPLQIYLSYLQKPSAYATLYVRAAGTLEAENLTRTVEAAIWRVDADQPIGEVTTLARAARGSVAYLRLYVVLFAVFAALTLGLAALGIYGTIAYGVGLRTREIGIRLALGAQRVDVLRLVLGQGVRLVVAGLVLGMGTALGLSRLLTSLLYGIQPTDPATLAAVALLLGGVSMLASWLPARRATRIDPLRALREE